MLPGESSKLGNEVRIGKKTHIKNQVCIARNTILEPETHDGNRQIAIALAYSPRELRINVSTEFMNIKSRCIKKNVCHIANRIKPFTFGADGSENGFTTSKRMRAPGFREASDESILGRFEKNDSGRQNLANFRKNRRKLLEAASFPNINHQRSMRDLSRLRHKIREPWDQFKGKVVD